MDEQQRRMYNAFVTAVILALGVLAALYLARVL